MPNNGYIPPGLPVKFYKRRPFQTLGIRSPLVMYHEHAIWYASPHDIWQMPHVKPPNLLTTRVVSADWGRGTGKSSWQNPPCHNFDVHVRFTVKGTWKPERTNMTDAAGIKWLNPIPWSLSYWQGPPTSSQHIYVTPCNSLSPPSSPCALHSLMSQLHPWSVSILAVLSSELTLFWFTDCCKQAIPLIVSIGYWLDYYQGRDTEAEAEVREQRM